MPTTLEYTQQAQEQTLKLIRDSQEGVVEAVRAWATGIEKAVPAIPGLQAIPAIPGLPLSDELPSPQELVQTSFAFAEQLLHTQREFVESVLAAVPSVPATEGKKPAAKSA